MAGCGQEEGGGSLTRGEEVVGVEVQGQDDAKRRLPAQAQAAHQAHHLRLAAGARAAQYSIAQYSAAQLSTAQHTTARYGNTSCGAQKRGARAGGMEGAGSSYSSEVPKGMRGPIILPSANQARMPFPFLTPAPAPRPLPLPAPPAPREPPPARPPCRRTRR